MENKKMEIAEFYEKIFSDTKLKEKLEEKAKAIVTEEDLRKLIREEIMPLMKKYNVNFSEKELLEYEEETLKKLSKEDLDNVSGGVSIKSALLTGGLLSMALLGGVGLNSSIADAVKDPPGSQTTQQGQQQKKKKPVRKFKPKLTEVKSDDNDKIQKESEKTAIRKKAKKVIEKKSTQSDNDDDDNNAQQPNNANASNLIAIDSNGSQYNYKIIDQGKMKVLISPVADLETWIIPSKVTIAGEEYNVVGTLERDINVENVVFSEGIREFNIKDNDRSPEHNEYLGKNNSIVIGRKAFVHFKKLKSIKFNENTKNLVFDDEACCDCENLVEVNLPDLETLFIRPGTFNGCKLLKRFSTPETLNMKAFTIGEGAFCNCKSLENFKILGNIAESIDIKTSAFLNCTSLKEFEILAHVTGTPYREENKVCFVGGLNIGDVAFKGCTNLVKFTIPENETINGMNIGRSAFNSTSLKEYSIPNTVHSLIIDKNAFSRCKALKQFTVLGDLNYGTINEGAFGTCTVLEEVNFGNINDNFDIMSDAFKNCKNLKNVCFDKVWGKFLIWENAFSNCKLLEKIIIPADGSDNEIEINSDIGVDYEIKYL